MTTACTDEARTPLRENAHELVLTACRAGDAARESRIDALWAAKTDPDETRRLLARHRLEVDAARRLLAAAGEPGWWRHATAEQVADCCTAARIWAEGDPICADLEHAFASRLRSALGVDLTRLPRAS